MSTQRSGSRWRWTSNHARRRFRTSGRSRARQARCRACGSSTAGSAWHASRSARSVGRCLPLRAGSSLSRAAAPISAWHSMRFPRSGRRTVNTTFLPKPPEPPTREHRPMALWPSLCPSTLPSQQVGSHPRALGLPGGSGSLWTAPAERAGSLLAEAGDAAEGFWRHSCPGDQFWDGFSLATGEGRIAFSNHCAPANTPRLSQRRVSTLEPSSQRGGHSSPAGSGPRSGSQRAAEGGAGRVEGQVEAIALPVRPDDPLGRVAALSAWHGRRHLPAGMPRPCRERSGTRCAAAGPGGRASIAE